MYYILRFYKSVDLFMLPGMSNHLNAVYITTVEKVRKQIDVILTQTRFILLDSKHRYFAVHYVMQRRRIRFNLIIIIVRKMKSSILQTIKANGRTAACIG